MTEDVIPHRKPHFSRLDNRSYNLVLLRSVDNISLAQSHSTPLPTPKPLPRNPPQHLHRPLLLLPVFLQPLLPLRGPRPLHLLPPQLPLVLLSFLLLLQLLQICPVVCPSQELRVGDRTAGGRVPELPHHGVGLGFLLKAALAAAGVRAGDEFLETLLGGLSFRFVGVSLVLARKSAVFLVKFPFQLEVFAARNARPGTF
jgi:hypothetical protein